MIRRLLAACCLVLAACSVSSEPVAEGVVTDVVGDLTTVESFSVRTTDGDDLVFVPASGMRFHGLGPLGHLRNHLASGEPVVVVYETGDDGTLRAIEVSDG